MGKSAGKSAAKSGAKKKRKDSSKRWLDRQHSDPYVAQARREGYRSRAAYKLIELNARFHFLKPGGRVVDLGAAPGGWAQVAVQAVGDNGHVVAVDLQDMDAVAGAIMLHDDFLEEEAPRHIKEALDGAADAVLSDMAAPTTGHAATDHLRIMALAEAALDFAAEVLAPGGTFVAKVLKGGTERQALARMKVMFTSVRHVKPPASRAESAEVYVVALGFRGTADR